MMSVNEVFFGRKQKLEEMRRSPGPAVDDKQLLVMCCMWICLHFVERSRFILQCPIFFFFFFTQSLFHFQTEVVSTHTKKIEVN